MRERIIVSMTSYPARIQNVPISIFALTKKQTLPPDEIHLWLAIPQFPRKEADLPEALVAMEKAGIVQIHWLEQNTYVHKRHEIFKIVNDGCVFLIDDDVIYHDNLIKSIMDVHAKRPDAIVCYNRYPKHKYSGRHILYEDIAPVGGPFVNIYRWCGQSMIPVNIYPKEILDDEHQKIRNQTSPISDECWFQPWVVLHNIPIFYCSYDWGTDISKNTGKDSGLVSWSHALDNNGFEKRDNWLYATVHAFKELAEKYKRTFNYD